MALDSTALMVTSKAERNEKAAYKWMEDNMWLSADGKYAFQPQTPLYSEDKFTKFVTALSKDTPGAEEEGHHSLDTPDKAETQGLNQTTLDVADNMVKARGMQMIKTLSVIDGGNMLTGRRADGRPYVLIGRDAILQTTLVNKHTYSDALIDEKLKTFDPDASAVSRMIVMLKAGDFMSQTLTGEEANNQAIRFLAMNEISQDIMADELNVPREDLVIISQPGFHIDMYLRPLADGRVLMQDDEETQKLVQRVLNDESNKSVMRRRKYKTDLEKNLEKTLSDLAQSRQEREKVTALINKQLEDAGLQVIKTPGVFKVGYRQVNYMNGIMGTSPTGEMFYLTNASSIEPLNQAFSAWIQEKQSGLNVHFVGLKDRFTESLLNGNGGFDCITLHHGTENLAQQMAAFSEGRVSVSSTSGPTAEKTVVQLSSYNNSLDSSVRVA
ncbi:hypothetical protein [Candidatus Fukatsuia endosymbiont of Tuberolachnus salignus]|uniref:hypothetical protein n=1 Tax=Candidatus Fukatsuia endosymbiont of Tuberolachnus salignus TaxID=3077957 RepID=UPI00313E1F81